VKRVVFIGQEKLGRACLQELHRLGAHIAAVFVPGPQMTARGIAQCSLGDLSPEGTPVFEVEDINATEHVRQIRALEPDLIYQIGWSQLLKGDLLAIPVDGVIGMHCSLLPHHRGRAPIPWSIIFGLRRSGMSMFYLDTNADKGDLIGQVTFEIGAEDYASDVYESATAAAVELVGTYHPLLVEEKAPRISQQGLLSDYWPKRTPADGLIDWNMSAGRLGDWVRALSHPFPGAFTTWSGSRLWIWKAKPCKGEVKREAGEVEGIVAGGIVVATGDGLLQLESVQCEGGVEEPASEFAARVAIERDMMLL
jgi:methionyl-tRNA formyltransferase